MFINSDSHLKYHAQRSRELESQAATERLLKELRPSFRHQLARSLHSLAHKLEPSLHTHKPVAQEC